MAKKKAPKKTRARSAPRRKAATPSRRPARRPKPRPVRPTIQLKPIQVLIDRAILDIQKLPPTEATEITVKQLQHCAMAFRDICDPETPGGCGPTMEFQQ